MVINHWAIRKKKEWRITWYEKYLLPVFRAGGFCGFTAGDQELSLISASRSVYEKKEFFESC